MCYKGNVLYCISVQSACIALAVVNVVINAINLIWYLILWGAIIFMYKHRDDIKNMDGFEELADVNLDIRTWSLIVGHVVFWMGFVPLASLLTIIFSFVLIIGISNRKPRHVKIYLVFGSVVTVLGLLAAVVEMALSSSVRPNILVMFVCVLHGLYLSLVYETYKKMLDEPYLDGHRRLVPEDSNFSQVLQRHLNSMDSISDLSISNQV